MTLTGIDISYAQGTFDCAHAVKDGAQFIIAKCSEGTAGVDAAFGNNWPAIAAAGVPRAAYQFSRWDLGTDPGAEAGWFLEHLPPLDPFDALVLDIEDSPAEVPGRELSGWALTWLDVVERARGRAPIVYSDAYFAARYLTDPRLAKYGLWAASYAPTAPEGIGPWSFLTLWQFTNRASFAGQTVDASYFFGSIDQFHAYGAVQQQPAPTPPARPKPSGARFLVLRDMAARGQPELEAVKVPTQMLYKGAVLDGTGRETAHWREVIAGGKAVWAYAPNLLAVR